VALPLRPLARRAGSGAGSRTLPPHDPTVARQRRLLPRLLTVGLPIGLAGGPCRHLPPASRPPRSC
jgi:hypothetical protein